MTDFIKKIRSDFPVLQQQVYGKPLVYLDNAATTQKPVRVSECVHHIYNRTNATIHRGVHFLSEQATEQYEEARRVVQQFIGAKNAAEVIFTSGTTGGINLVAYSFAEQFLKPGDEVLVSEMEHHANIVPWQVQCDRKGAVLKVIPINENGEISLDAFAQCLSPKTRIVAVTHASNVLGTVNPVKEMIRIAHGQGIPVLVDGAQAIQHGAVDVVDLDCDFYLFSGHKIYGPTGIGVLYGKQEWLEQMPPYQTGGDMVDVVTFEKTTYNVLPLRFEAGTTNYIGAIGLAEALRYLQDTGIENIQQAEAELGKYAMERLAGIEGLTIYGRAKERLPIFSMNVPGIHFYDIGMILDKMGIAVRTGTHCAQPLMQRLGVEGTLRASFCFYNTREEVDVLVDGLSKSISMLR